MSRTCDERSFVLPSVCPEESLGVYTVTLDQVTGIFHVASRYRYVSLKEFFEIQQTPSRSRSTHFAEFSKGTVAAVLRKKVTHLRNIYSQLYANECTKSLPLSNSVKKFWLVEQVSPKSSGTDRSRSGIKVTTSKPSQAQKLLQIVPDAIFQSELLTKVSACPLNGDSSILKLGPITYTANISHSSTKFVSDTTFSRTFKAALTNGSLIGDDVRSNSSKPGILDDQAYETLDMDARASSPSSLGSSSALSAGTQAHFPLSTPSSPNSNKNLIRFQKCQARCHKHPGSLDDLSILPKSEKTIPSSLDDLITRANRKDGGLPDNDFSEIQYWTSKLPALHSSLHMGEYGTVRETPMPEHQLDTLDSQHTLSESLTAIEKASVASIPRLHIDRSTIRNLPSFSSEMDQMSRRCNALDLTQQMCKEKVKSKLFHLDLALLCKRKKQAYKLQGQCSFTLSDHLDIEISLDTCSGELYLPSLKAPRVFAESNPDQTSNSLGLRSYSLDDAISTIDEINVNYCQIWTQAHPGIPRHFAMYHEATVQLAVEKFQISKRTLLSETLHVVQEYISAFLKIWREGHPNEPNAQWIAEQDETVVKDVAVKMVEWNHMVSASAELRNSFRPQPGSMKLAESSSYADSFLHAPGGDGQYAEYRSEGAKETNIEEIQNEQRPIHHINFNNLPVYERSYTPPEVSFWAASTTYSKILLGKPLPCVHYAKVITSQAFKWVDPTRYIGENIDGLWQKTGSELRNAATSDVKVVYQPIGTWNQDQFTENDAVPDVAPETLAYEYATNGSYNVLQLPYLFNIWHDENRMFHVNEGKPSEFRHTRVLDYNKERPCLLKYELGKALAEKAALLQRAVEKSHSPQKAVNVLKDVAEEDWVADEYSNAFDESLSEADPDSRDGWDVDHNHDTIGHAESNAGVSDAEEQSAEDCVSPATRDTSPESEDLDVDFMIKSGLDRIEKLKAHVCSRLSPIRFDGYEEEVSFVESEKESFDGDNGITDHNSIWPEQCDPIQHPRAERLSQFFDHGNTDSFTEIGDNDENQTCKTLEYDNSDAIHSSHSSRMSLDAMPTIGTLENGRYCSPSKMVLSKIDEVRTPVQNPIQAQDFGSWELNEFSPHETSKTTAALESKDGTLSGNQTSWSAFSLRRTTKNWFTQHKVDPEIVPFPYARSLGTSSCGDDVFASDPTIQIQAQLAHGIVFGVPQAVPWLLSFQTYQNLKEQPRIPRSRCYQSASSPVTEVDSDIDEPTPRRQANELVLSKAPGFFDMGRSLSREHPLGKQTMSGLRHSAAFASAVAVRYAFRGNSGEPSHFSWPSEPSSKDASGNHSPSSSLIESLSGAKIQEELASQAEVKRKGLRASRVSYLIGSPVQEHCLHSTHENASITRRDASEGNPCTSRKGWLKGEAIEPEEVESMMPEGDCNSTKAPQVEGIPAPSSSALSVCYQVVADIPLLQAATSKPFSICSYTVADIPLTKPSNPTKPNRDSALEAQSTDEMPGIELEMLAPPIVLALGWVASKLGKWVLSRVCSE